MPGTNIVHIDKPLTNLAVHFRPTNMIVDQIFPMIPVSKQSDLYFVYDKADFFRLPDSTLRAEKTKGRIIEYSVSSESYVAENYALVEEISFETLANADKPLQVEREAVNQIQGMLMTDWETRVASLILTSSNLGSSTTLSGNNQWNNVESDPIADIDAGQDAILSTTGKEANLLIIGWQVWQQLKNHPDILDRIKYVQKGIVGKDLLAQLFDVDRVLVGKAISNSGNEGEADSYNYIWGKNAVLAHVADAPSTNGRTASLGYSFRWNNPRLGAPFAVERWENPDRHNYVNVRAQYYQDEKIVSSELGYLIADAVG